MMKSIVEAVFQNAEKTPDKLCLVDDTRTVTYREYADEIARMATVLETLGIKSGSRVVIEASQTISYLASELAVQLLKAVFVPLEKGCASEKIASMATRANASFILTNADVSLEVDIPRKTIAEIAEATVTASKKNDIDFPEADTISEILFSTGTTGKEKGIVLTHGNDIALAENVAYSVNIQEDNVEMIPSPMNHSHGLRRYYANLWKGASVVLLGSIMDVRRFFHNMEDYGVNSLDLVPAALSVLLRLSKDNLAKYSEVIRYIQFGSAPLMKSDKDWIRRLLPNTNLYNFYGSTESGCICCYEFNHTEDKENCIGKPTYNAHIFMVDDEKKEISSDSTHTGLLASKGAMNMVGYLDDPEETEKVLKDGSIYSNDVAYFDEDGDVILLGRAGDVINIGGKKVSPEEIEDAAKKMPMIEDCACVPVSDEIKGHVPKLYVKVAAGYEFQTAEIRDWLLEHLEPYKVPAYYEEIDAIPRTSNGKILRRKL
ncbi:MAG: acyl--CoA ligase [Lachnospiraceae bacterium]|nr:acyl--CoA ligase [Lachnospiraceae bacterium]